MPRMDMAANMMSARDHRRADRVMRRWVGGVEAHRSARLRAMTRPPVCRFRRAVRAHSRAKPCEIVNGFVAARLARRQC